MNGRAIGLAVFTLLVVGALAAADEPGKPDRPWGESSGGLRSRIWLEKPRARPGDPVKVRYEIQNAGEEKATIWRSGFWPNHRVDATTTKGEDLEPTAAGKRCREAFSPLGGRDKHAPLVLAPGESRSYEPPRDLDALFVLPEGGFRVRIVYQEGRMEPVESNLLEVPAVGR